MFNLIAKKSSMKQTTLFGICIVAISLACSQEQEKELVARKDFDVSKDWQPRQIMGKDFWLLNTPEYLGVPQMRDLEEKPLFTESAVVYTNTNSITVPGSNKVSISAMSPASYLELIEKRPQAPFLIMPNSVKPPQGLMKDFEHDFETYNAWKHTHPNFMGWINAEIDNDFFRTLPWRNGDLWQSIRMADDKELIETIEREFPKPQNREEMTLQFFKGLEANRKYFFNDIDKVNYLRASHCFDHYFYESGSDFVALETTNTGDGEDGVHYRHQVSLFFTRGAAHQYNKNWMWYIAFFYNGYDDQGKFSGDNIGDYRVEKPLLDKDYGSYYGPGCGMSESLLTRDMFLAYLSGPSFVCSEGWWFYLNESRKDGRSMWDLSSPYGKAWEDWFEFTRKNPDRGTSFAPVVLLVPFTQGYPNYGGKSWGIFDYERPDWMIDAFMFSIVPRSPVTKNGDEGALSNSPYGDIYDVITPDTPEKPVSLEVLNNYKVAIMLGKYAKDKAFSERMMEYVENGGTLLLNINQINEFFPAEFLGFERTTGSDNIRDIHAVTGPIRSLLDGKSFRLLDEYEMEAIKLTGATPLLEDAKANVPACLNKYGKGNVIVATVDYLLPKNSRAEWPDGVYGKTFPFVEYFLGNFVKEVLPLEVNGDIQYGLNKLSDGWLLYLINNKGVTKFTNKAQVLDISKTAKVEVSLGYIKASKIIELREQRAVPINNNNKSFTIDVPPGEVKVVKIEKKH